jgi:hypothetical protein
MPMTPNARRLCDLTASAHRQIAARKLTPRMDRMDPDILRLITAQVGTTFSQHIFELEESKRKPIHFPLPSPSMNLRDVDGALRASRLDPETVRLELKQAKRDRAALESARRLALQQQAAATAAAAAAEQPQQRQAENGSAAMAVSPVGASESKTERRETPCDADAPAPLYESTPVDKKKLVHTAFGKSSPFLARKPCLRVCSPTPPTTPTRRTRLALFSSPLRLHQPAERVPILSEESEGEPAHNHDHDRQRDHERESDNDTDALSQAQERACECEHEQLSVAMNFSEEVASTYSAPVTPQPPALLRPSDALEQSFSLPLSQPRSPMRDCSLSDDEQLECDVACGTRLSDADELGMSDHDDAVVDEDASQRSRSSIADTEEVDSTAASRECCVDERPALAQMNNGDEQSLNGTERYDVVGECDSGHYDEAAHDDDDDDDDDNDLVESLITAIIELSVHSPVRGGELKPHLRQWVSTPPALGRYDRLDQIRTPVSLLPDGDAVNAPRLAVTPVRRSVRLQQATPTSEVVDMMHRHRFVYKTNQRVLERL